MLFIKRVTPFNIFNSLNMMIYYMNMESKMRADWLMKIVPLYTDGELNKYRVNKHELHHHRSVSRMP